MFFRWLTLFWTLMHIYVFWRASTVPMVARKVPRKILFGAGLVLWAGFIPGRLLRHGDPGLLSRIMESYFMHWMAVLFLFFTVLLAVDLVTLFGLPAPRIARKMRGWALAAGVILSALAFVQGLRPPVVRNHEVILPGLPAGMDGTVLVAISDTHLGTMIGAGWMEKRLGQVRELDPDVVVLLGDIVEGHGGRPEEEILPVLAGLDAPLGVWAVSGNHEYHGRSGGNSSAIEEAGHTVLHNRWAEVAPGLVLAGVDDLTRHSRGQKGDDPVGTALGGRPPGAAVFLSHSPLEAERAAEAGAGLMLSAHTHGGQVWPFGCLVRLRYPLLAGRYDVDGMPVIVSRGTGTWGPRMRLWQPGEILRVVLRSPVG